MKFGKSLIGVVFAFLIVVGFPASLHAATPYELNRDARKALQVLYEKNPKALEIAMKADAMLVFPTIVKAGFIFGAQGGQGVLYRNGQVSGYYQSTAISYGLQAGVQKYGYVLFFMNHKALSYLRKSEGWEVGVGPSIVIVDEGVAKTMSTTTMQDDIYAFIFDQKGLMAGLGIQGSKITQYTPDDEID